jgi:ankyrin repeat protein
VEAGADINAMSGVSAECNPLRCASGRSCCNKVLQAFLDSGADSILISTTAGVTALHTAAAMGLAGNCELLLTRESSLVNMQDINSCTALSHAAAQGSIDIIKVLLQHGADMITMNTNNSTPLMTACVHNNVDVAILLINAGADVNVASSDAHCALWAAVMSNSTVLVQLLLDHGALISRTNIIGRTVAFVAAYKGHVSIL